MGEVYRGEVERWWETSRPAVGHLLEVYLHMLVDFINNHPDLASEPKIATAGHVLYTTIEGTPSNPETGTNAIPAQPALGPSFLPLNFRELKHYFIPILRAGHASLIAISPLHKRIEYFDSLQRTPNVYPSIFATILYLLHNTYGRDFVYTEWAVRIRGNCPLQLDPIAGDGDCGVYACLFAQHVACNIDLCEHTWGSDARKRRLRTEQRRRVVRAVQHGSFTGDFELQVAHPADVRRADNRLANADYGYWESLPLAGQPGVLAEVVEVFPAAVKARGWVGRMFDTLTSKEAVYAWCGMQFIDVRGGRQPMYPERDEWMRNNDLEGFISRIEVREMEYAIWLANGNRA